MSSIKISIPHPSKAHTVTLESWNKQSEDYKNIKSPLIKLNLFMSWKRIRDQGPRSEAYIVSIKYI